MTMMIQRVNANSPAQAVKSRARGPTIRITQLRAKQAALVAAAELAASSNAEASVVRPPVDEAKRCVRRSCAARSVFAPTEMTNNNRVVWY